MADIRRLCSSVGAELDSDLENDDSDSFNFNSSPPTPLLLDSESGTGVTARRSPRLQVTSTPNLRQSSLPVTDHQSPTPRRSPRLKLKQTIRRANVHATQTNPPQRKPPIRRKIIPVRHTNSKTLRSALSKRKATLFRRAHELWQVTGANVLVVVQVSNIVKGLRTYYGGSEALVTLYETAGIKRGTGKFTLQGLYGDDGLKELESDDDTSHQDVPVFMQSSMSSDPGMSLDTGTEEQTMTAREEQLADEREVPSAAMVVTSAAGEQPLMAKMNDKLKKQSVASKNPRKQLTFHTVSPARKTVAVSNTENRPGNDIIAKLRIGMWVAVAYYEAFYIGQVTDCSKAEIDKTVVVKFLQKKYNTFLWAEKPELATILTVYIIQTDVNMSIDKGRCLRYICDNLIDIQKAYIKFKKDNREIL